MGWMATAQALMTGDGPYGNVKQSLEGEIEPRSTLLMAMRQVIDLIDADEYDPRPRRKSLSQWASRAGLLQKFKDACSLYNYRRHKEKLKAKHQEDDHATTRTQKTG